EERTGMGCGLVEPAVRQPDPWIARRALRTVDQGGGGRDEGRRAAGPADRLQRAVEDVGPAGHDVGQRADVGHRAVILRDETILVRGPGFPAAQGSAAGGIVAVYRVVPYRLGDANVPLAEGEAGAAHRGDEGR